MTEHDLGPDPEEDSDVEEVVFEEIAEQERGSSRTAPVEAPFKSGQILGGRFEVRRTLRAGSLSQFLCVKDRVLGGPDITLEIIDRSVLSGIENLPERIRTVVPRLKEAAHEVIDPLLDFGMLPDGRLYFASQLMAGKSLSELLSEGSSLAPEEAFGTTQRLVRALEYGLTIHQVHGALDGHNVFFEEGPGGLAQRLRLLSFGRQDILAPKGKTPSEGRDLQAIGPLLAQMLVGQPIKGEVHAWWDARAPKLPKQAADFVAKALDTVQGRGFKDLGEFRVALESLPQFRTSKETPKTLVWISVAFAAGLLGAAGTWMFLHDTPTQNEVLAGESNAVSALDSNTKSDDPGESGSAAPVQSAVQEIGRLRNGLDLTNQAVVDLRATTHGYDTALQEMQSHLDALNANEGMDAESRAREAAELRASMQALETHLSSIDGRLVTLESEQEATTDSQAGQAQSSGSSQDKYARLLPPDADSELRDTAEKLFSDKASPFGPIGSRALHHTLSAEGDEGWMITTVDRDENTPKDAEQSWLLEEEYMNAKGKPLGSRRLRVVQRGGKYEEVDGRTYPLLDLESPWIDLSTLDFESHEDRTPPASLAVPEGALEAFQARLAAEPLVALVKVDGTRRSWFVPGLGFVRYEDPTRIRRELVLMEAR